MTIHKCTVCDGVHDSFVDSCPKRGLYSFALHQLDASDDEAKKLKAELVELRTRLAACEAERDGLRKERDELRGDCDAYAEFDEHVRDVVDAADAWHDRECSGEHDVCLQSDSEHDAECEVSKAART